MVENENNINIIKQWIMQQIKKFDTIYCYEMWSMRQKILCMLWSTKLNVLQ